ncbi:YitT family protein [Falsirhodobacter xinxiangensis]|uniref:YitT family protein n=1 Tax=Falsirhodobacter xinxiangensis TaxID=2530049 RepID=UPI0010AA502F|nr:YitT family protein [Rhodobacter xinxiangensis]
MTGTPKYTRIEDAQGLVISTILCALGIHLLRAAGLVTGGTAGLALLIAYSTGWAFGWVFFCVNLPFYVFAWKRRGAVFTIKGFLSVSAVSALAEALPAQVPLDGTTPAAAAILFGIASGVGLLGLFRHGASLGGISIVAVILQDLLGIRAGWVQLGWDLCLFAVALAVLPWGLVFWSLVGAVVLNLVIAINHRRDWYLPQ